MNKYITKTQALFLSIAIFALIGLIASFILTIDKFIILENPNTKLGCEINTVVSCTSVMNAPQSNILGFPNSLVGILGYSVVLTIAATSIFQVIKNKNYWRLFVVGNFMSFAFSVWLLSQSMYYIKSLCPYCILSFTAASLIFFASVLFSVRHNHFPGLKVNWEKNKSQIITGFFAGVFLWFVIISGLIYLEFGDLLFR